MPANKRIFGAVSAVKLNLFDYKALENCAIRFVF